MAKNPNNWAVEEGGGKVRLKGSGPACYQCSSCINFCKTADNKRPYGCTVASNDTAASLVIADIEFDECKHYGSRGNVRMAVELTNSGKTGGTAHNFMDTFGITATVKTFESAANDGGFGLAVGAGKLLGKAAAKGAAKIKAKVAQQMAEKKFQKAQEDAEKKVAEISITSIDFGKDSVSTVKGLNALLNIIAAYRYELKFPYGLEGSCSGALEPYKEAVWRQAMYKAEQGLKLLRKQGSTEADAFAEKLQAERDNVDPEIVKARLLEAKEEAGATTDEIKEDDSSDFFTKKLEKVDSLISETNDVDGLTDNLKDGFGSAASAATPASAPSAGASLLDSLGNMGIGGAMADQLKQQFKDANPFKGLFGKK
jgi:hypothetical protein